MITEEVFLQGVSWRTRDGGGQFHPYARKRWLG